MSLTSGCADTCRGSTYKRKPTTKTANKNAQRKRFRIFVRLGKYIQIKENAFIKMEFLMFSYHNVSKTPFNSLSMGAAQACTSRMQALREALCKSQASLGC